MTKNETIHVRVNSTVKNNAEAALDMLGISVSEAINMFLCQVSLVGGIPFEVKLPAPARVIVRSEEELDGKLNASDRDIAEGRTVPADEAFARLEDKYGL
ncbi:type II toxin-antitoxin system RelB/DinJ family antitoxin [uncultured Ruminococcus sp.]|uniref:type II toxin-antitoxin system RelB/DinJ family antitoxin n=1 Tax=uncultured Ruminococcus sp. TaxID=165186 RepID=UPI0025E3C86C|nr:type II toxin-antitoxin system RelB/DinJ family antitoxin [uncultured Ruminococcus sp.]